MNNFQIKHSNLPHVINSCGINALFISLSYLKIKSTNQLIQDMIDYCSNEESKNDVNNGIELVKLFYKTYNLDYGLQNSRLLLQKFYNTLIFEDQQIEIGDDYEKIELNKKFIMLDYEQLKSIIEYNYEEYFKKPNDLNYFNNKICIYNDDKYIKTKQVTFNSNMIIKYNNYIYMPCLYVICRCAHYICIVTTKNGTLIYNDLAPIRIISDEHLNNLYNNLIGVEFICYIRKELTNGI